MKRLLASLLAIVLVVTLFPAGIVKQAEAAGTATYFIPDILELRSTSTLTTTTPVTLSRDTAYTTTNGNLTITGAFAYVSANSMSAKVEQLNLNVANSTWSVDSTHFNTSNVTEDPTSPNRFIASNLTLFSGMNRITFTGTQGSVQRSDVFYVLFDQIPYIQNLKITSGPSLVDLNEGAPVVVPNASVSLQGVAKNATRVTAGIQGTSPVQTTVYEDGMFFTPAFLLKAGKNTINMTITNGTNTINVARVVYYYDEDHPFSNVSLIHTASSTDPYALYPLEGGGVPQISVGDATYNTAPVEQASLRIQMLVPYAASTSAFAGTATYNINNNGDVLVNASDLEEAETIIPGSDGQPLYRLVTFNTGAYFLQGSGTEYRKDQTVSVTVDYGTYDATFNGSFKYFPGETVIKNVYYLPKYNGTDDVDSVTKMPLHGAEVSSPSFYILVEADKDVTSLPNNALKGRFLPLGTNAVDLVIASATGLDVNQRVYQVNNFPSGQQRVEFKYGTSNSTYNANVSYVSQSYIYVANLTDGQTFEYDSRNTNNNITINGEFIGFNGGAGSPQMFVNATAVGSFSLTNGKFSVTVAIGGSNSLVFGENRIVFKGVNTLGAGNTQEIIKEVKIYIIDKNVSTVAKFMPVLAVDGRQAMNQARVVDYTVDQLNRIFSVTPEFSFQDGKYKTSQLKYDLAIRGYGAKTLNLKLGSETIFTYSITDTNQNYNDANYVLNATTSYRYDFSGNDDDFVIRIEDIPFPAPGTYVYTLELINETGAITRQSLELTRDVSPYRLLSPVPTVGNQIMVNKNFVRFDIEAEGATEVWIGKEKAAKRSDLNNRFVYDYVGLKADKLTEIPIRIVRADSTLQDEIGVYYSSTVQLDSQYMAPILAKHSYFNKGLQLSFPKGTVLKSVTLNNLMAPKLYNNTQLLFGVANPADGVVERKNDYGNIIGVDYDARTLNGASQIIIPDRIALRFASNTNTSNFTRISNIYWISGGIGELGDKGQVGYKPATNGLAPYSIEGNFTEYEAGRKLAPSNRGTLTLGFDDSVVEDVSYMITVFRYTDAGVWENVGGEVNAKSHTIEVPFDEFGYYQVVKMRKSYTDVTNHGWARNILNALYSKGIMTNMRVDEFGANDLTTRGEFATLLVKGLNLPLKASGNQTFFDITPGTRTSTWDYEHIETAARAGIVNGLSEGFFGPDIRITREDAAVMIAKALQLKMSVNNDKLASNLAKAFVDSGSIHIYARPAIEAVNKAKIMTGSPTTIPGQTKPLMSFNPKGNMTRAEAGKIAIALFQKSTSIFPKNLS